MAVSVESVRLLSIEIRHLHVTLLLLKVSLNLFYVRHFEIRTATRSQYLMLKQKRIIVSHYTISYLCCHVNIFFYDHMYFILSCGFKMLLGAGVPRLSQSAVGQGSVPLYAIPARSAMCVACGSPL